jgi:hypothetical protein
MTKNYIIVDKCPGVTEFSLETMEDVLKQLSIVHAQDNPVKIFELRDYRSGGPTGIGFYLKSPIVEGVIGHSFWVPGRMNYAELDENITGGTGFGGYKRAIAMIYRYLNHQPRVIVEAGEKEFGSIIADPISAGEIVDSLDVKEIVEETPAIIPRLINDLYNQYDFSFISFDIETNRNFVDPDFVLAYSWDMYHGLRPWNESEGKDLMEEANRFDKVVTFNGKRFDLRIMAEHAPEAVAQIREGKDVDLYDIINVCCHDQKQYRRRGELTLANVAFTTLGLCKWEVHYQPDMDKRREEIDDGIKDHCARDAEMTKELFFHMMENERVYYVSRKAMEEGRVVDSIYTQAETIKRLLSETKRPPGEMQ